MANLKKLWLFIPFFCVFLMSHNTFAETVTVDVEKTSYSGLTSWRSYSGIDTIQENLTNYRQSGNYPFYLLSTQSAWRRYLWNFTNEYTISNPDNYSGANLVVQDTLQYRGVNNTNVFSTQQYKHSVTMTFTDNTTSTYDCYTGQGVIWTQISNGNGYLYAQCIFTAQKPLKSFSHRIGNDAWSESNSIVKMGVGQGNGLYAYAGFYSGELYIDEVPVVIPQLDGISNQLDDLSDDINNHYQQENDAVDNISNQNQPDVGDNSKGTSILNTAANLFNQIVSVPKGVNCQVPADWGNLNLGLIDFCQGKENFTFVVNFVSSISVVVIVIGTSLILVRQILALYDWARGK